MKATIIIPKGWERVRRGKIKAGDRYLDARRNLWREIKELVGWDLPPTSNSCVIRQKKPPR